MRTQQPRPLLDRAFGDGFTAGLIGFGYVCLAIVITFGVIAVAVTWVYLWPLYVITGSLFLAALFLDWVWRRTHD